MSLFGRLMTSSLAGFRNTLTLFFGLDKRSALIVRGHDFIPSATQAFVAPAIASQLNDVQDAAALTHHCSPPQTTQDAAL